MKPLARWPFLWLWLWLLSAVAADATEPVKMRLATDTTPVWSAATPQESLGTQGSMLYPAPNAGGLLAAILTHSLLVDQARSSERAEQLARAEQTLQPLRPAIDALDTAQLLQGAQAHLDEHLPGGIAVGPLEIKPAYAVLTDHRAIALDVLIKVGGHGAGDDTEREVRVHVVSPTVTAANPTAHWLADDGAALRREASALLGHAIDVALRFPHPPGSDVPPRTQRYLYGSDIRMERGQPVATGCGRVVLFTLRSHWMSVPLPSNNEGTTCDDHFRVDGG